VRRCPALGPGQQAGAARLSVKENVSRQGCARAEVSLISSQTDGFWGMGSLLMLSVGDGHWERAASGGVEGVDPKKY